MVNKIEYLWFRLPQNDCAAIENKAKFLGMNLSKFIGFGTTRYDFLDFAKSEKGVC